MKRLGRRKASYICSFIFLFLCHTILAAPLLQLFKGTCIYGEAELESMFSTAGK